MKTIPTEALGFIAVAASNVATKLGKTATAPANSNAIAKQPQLSRRLQQHLAAANDVSNTNNDGNGASSNALTTAATRLLEESSTTCDASFLKCVLSPTCRGCFESLQENDIDWTNVVPETPCQDVMGFLVAGGHCVDVKNGGAESQETFCGAFDACVVWDDEDEPGKGPAKEGDENATKDDSTAIDCAALTECKWPGMHEHFLGDGVCHDAMPGCYNSKVCNYDGGDCCEDSCHYPGGSKAEEGDDYGECGMEGYACRDPSSIKCQPALAQAYKEVCSKMDEEDALMGFDDDWIAKKEEILPDCSSSESLYRLVQFDSWGDGWDETVLTLKEHVGNKEIYKGGLKYGSQGTIHLCLTKSEAKCYHVTVENGVWGNEISWELRPLAGGAPVLAAGGSPSDCTVSLGGAAADCPDTCDSTRPDTKIEDPNYKSYKDMESCIEQKCLIQVGNCAQDDSCSECMQESSPDYCFANENFNVLIDCSMCTCTETRPAYCDAKSSGADPAHTSGSSAGTHEGNIKPSASGGSATFGSATGGTTVCGPDATLKGTSSLVKFSQCADVDQMMAMVTEFDNDNFGMLDLFEDCAHTYNDDPLHGGKEALDCMKVLHNMVMDEEDDKNDSADGSDIFKAKNARGEVLPQNIGKAIGSLAHHLYHDAEDFCDCSANVNRDTPMCSSFINFKTLLSEAVDACRSLDQIDCAAWEEFYGPCKKNLMEKYDTVDFDKQEQCSYVEGMCGGAGPFPAFRRLDCGGEIAKSAWDFHTLYARGCLKSTAGSSSGSIPSSPTPAVLPTPSTPSTPITPSYTPRSPSSSSSTTKKQYTPYSANGASDEKKPYYSPSYGDSDSEPEEEEKSSSYTEKKTHHFIRNTFILMVLASAGFVVHKKRRENFNYMRFRQLREARNYAGGLNAGGGGAGEYTGVSMNDSCSFEPPTLPPTPSDNTTMI